MEESLKRCSWGNHHELLREYHDNEWGVEVYDDKLIFEHIVLETFQAGLSWLIVLKKREAFRKAFDDFDVKKISLYNEAKIASLKEDKSIIRNSKKIEAIVTNAIAYIKVQKEFGSFSNYLWGFVDFKPIIKHPKTFDDLEAFSELSILISKDLKKRGFKFLGKIVIYSKLQALGLINEHLDDCAFKFRK